MNELRKQHNVSDDVCPSVLQAEIHYYALYHGSAVHFQGGENVKQSYLCALPLRLALALGA